MSNFIYRLKTLSKLTGLAVIREMECKECIRNNQTMEIRYKPEGETLDEVMKLTPEQLISKRVTKPFWMKPKNTRSGQGYWVWEYIWDTEPDES